MPTNAPLLTLARALKRRKARERQLLFVAEGVRAVEELLRSPLQIRGALGTDAVRRLPRGEALIAALAARHLPFDEVSEKDFLSAADTEHPQGILAVAEVPNQTITSLPLGPAARILVLDAIQDPGNVGTLVRTAAAMGAAAVVALPGTADLWNAKVVRSAAGAHFRLPLVHSSVDELLTFLTDNQIALWGTAADGAPIGAVTAPPRLAIAVGNEGAGLSDRIRTAAIHVVSLPMAGGVESLNVAVAAGITLYALRQ